MSEIIEGALDTMKGLYKMGFIDKKKMDEFKEMCKPIPDYDADKIVKIRKEKKLSQAALADLFNISPDTVRKWEQNLRPVKGAYQKLYYILDNKGIEVLL